MGGTAAPQEAEALRETCAYLRSLIESSPDALVTVDATGKITDVNTAAVKITGVARNTLLGGDFASCFTDAEKARAFCRRAFDKGKVSDFPITVCHASGTVAEVLCNATVYRNEHGKESGVLVTVRDITALRRAEQAQRESEERLLVASRVAGLGTFTYYFEFDARLFSPELKTLMGLAPDVPILLYADRIPVAIHQEDREAFRTAQLAARDPHGAGRFELDCRIYWPDGAIRWLHVMWQTEFEGKGERRQPWRVVGAALDITERKRTEDALKDALRDIRTLRGIVPICAKCKKIRDDQGYWEQVEVYVHQHTEAEFSHGICPDCMKVLYPDYC